MSKFSPEAREQIERRYQLLKEERERREAEARKKVCPLRHSTFTKSSAVLPSGDLCVTSGNFHSKGYNQANSEGYFGRCYGSNCMWFNKDTCECKYVEKDY